MTDLLPPVAQRPKLLAFAAACCTCADKRRDEFGGWAIFDKQGHVYGWQFPSEKIFSTYRRQIPPASSCYRETAGFSFCFHG
jgi:hypothetical protein